MKDVYSLKKQDNWIFVNIRYAPDCYVKVSIENVSDNSVIYSHLWRRAEEGAIYCEEGEQIILGGFGCCLNVIYIFASTYK